LKSTGLEQGTDLWETVHMAKRAKRTMRMLTDKIQAPGGYKCAACAWAFPIPGMTLEEGQRSPSDKAIRAFENHSCLKFPKPEKGKREDFSQAAARIVREATKS
jgi:hypothetical protein